MIVVYIRHGSGRYLLSADGRDKHIKGRELCCTSGQSFGDRVSTVVK
ncbi:hypothetical protein [Paenibacillus sp. Root52]|nr:hypothetical protein [Paenibacillus sp. Root52]